MELVPARLACQNAVMRLSRKRWWLVAGATFAVGLTTYMLWPEEPQNNTGQQRHATGDREAEVERTGEIDEPAVIFLCGRQGPGRDAADASHFTLMFAREVLGEGMVNRKNAERSGSNQEKNSEKKRSFWQPNEA